MKKILITGKNSYIGTSVKNWLLKTPDQYEVDTIDLRNPEWFNKDFSKYDAVIYVAGIAHIKESSKSKKKYFEINRDLAFRTAIKAKKDGVFQFVYLSSMSVYGMIEGVIKKGTIPQPNTVYGISKLEGEKLLKTLEDHTFKLCILRPAMVYGENCKGNYPRLMKLALRTPFFPSIENIRSMIYIDNLSEFIKQVVDNKIGGLYFPQNTEYVNTSEMVKLIAELHGKQIYMTTLLNPILSILNIKTLKKMFSNLVYEMSMSDFESNYRVIGFNDSIKKTELWSKK